MLPLVVLHILVFQRVERAAQVGLIADIVAELLGKARERVVLVEVAAGGFGDLSAERGVAEGDQDGRDVAEELVEGRGLGEDGFVVMRANAVEYGMAKLVIDDVGREAGVDALARAPLAAVEVVELQGLAVSVIESVFAVAGMWYDDETVALEPPRDTAAKTEAAFEEVECVLQRRPDVHLAELRGTKIIAIEDLAFGVHELAEIGVPAGRRVQNLCPAVVVHNGKARTGRAVTKPGLPWHGELLVEVVGRVGRRDLRILEVDIEGDAEVQLDLRIAIQKLSRRIKFGPGASDSGARLPFGIRFGRDP